MAHLDGIHVGCINERRDWGQRMDKDLYNGGRLYDVVDHGTEPTHDEARRLFAETDSAKKAPAVEQ